MKQNITIFIFCLFLSHLQAQSWGEYTLVARQNQTSATLINLAKTTVKTWTGSGGTGYSAYMLQGGTLLRSVVNSGNSFSGGGMTGKIQKIDANNNTIWDYTYSTSAYCMHHDICPMPNGNVLIISYEAKTAAEVSAAGANTGIVVWSEKIVELQPTGLNTANVVWEWKLWDHLAQSVNSAKPNYVTSIVNNPQLMNINYNLQKDWVHMNGIDYNPTTDQIVVSSHNLNELWLIDHSTSTAQAASHSGGNSGKGGDFLYRWGNPAAYGAAGTAVYNVVHDAHWVNDGPYTGYFAAFNNKGVSASQSSVDYFLPNYTLTPGSAYLPSTYGARQSGFGYSSNMGNSQQLPNGNTLICVATAGNIYEMNSAGTIIWSHSTGGTTPQARRYEASYLCGTPPTASASASQTAVCPSTNISLNANATGSSLTYAWASSPTGFTSTAASPSVTPTATTTYTVTVTSGACSSTSSVVVTYNANPTVTIAPTPSATVCNGAAVTLTANASGGSGFIYNWSGNGLSSTTQNPNFIPPTSGAYLVTVTNSNGCTGTATQNITVNTLPSTMPSAAQTTVCQGNTTTLNANASGGTTYTYNWASSPVGFSSTSATPTVSLSANTTYTVTVTSNGCTATGNISVGIYAPPIVDAGNDVTIAQGSSANLTASGGNTYSWSNGSSGATISVSPTTTTTYFVTVTDANGCTATDNVKVTVQGMSISASAAQTTLCAGLSTTLNVNVVGGVGGNIYAWSANQGGFTSSSQNPSVTPTSTTTYTVTVTSGILSSTSSVTVNVTPTPTLTANATPNTICSGQNAQLSAIASGGSSYTYSWSNGVNVFSSNQNPSVTPSSTTNYTVTVTSNGCSSTSSASVVVNPSPSANAGSNVAIDQGKSTVLTASGGGNYLWSNGVTTASTSVSPSTTTTYYVTVTNGNGCTATSQVVVSVNPLIASASASQTTICNGKTVQLDVITSGDSGGTNSYNWSSNQGGNFSTQKSPSVTPSTTTIYTVVVTNGTQSTSSSVTVNVNANPSIIISPSQNSICNGTSVQLNTSVSGTLSNAYAWSASNGFSSSIQSPTNTPSVTTTYSLTVTSNKGCSATSNVVITVKQSPLVTIKASLDSICAGATVNLEAIPSNGTSYNYLWSSSPVDLNVSIKNPSVIPTFTTTYIVTVTSDGCSAIASKTVKVNPLPNANAGADVTINQGEKVKLIATGGTNYVWSNGITKDTNTVMPSATTTYFVTVTNTKGCSASSQVNVTVQGGILSAIANVDKNKICLGDSIKLNAVVSGGLGNNTFSWTSIPAGFTSNLQQPVVKPTENTTYFVSITSGAQTASSSVSVTVNARPIANAGSDISIVGGQTVTLSASGGDNFLWNTGATTKDISINPTSTTTYFVIVTDKNSCSASDSVAVKVSILEAIATANVPQKLCAGSVVQLNVLVNGGIGASTYQWASTPDGFSSTLKNPSVTPTITSVYLVTVTNSGVETTASIKIEVLQLPTTPSISQKGDTLISSATQGNHWYFNGTISQDTLARFAPKSSGSYQVQVIDTNGCKSALSTAFAFAKSSVFDKLNSNPLMVYPNPTSGKFAIQGAFINEGGYSVEIYNNQGMLLQKHTNSSDFDISELSNQQLHIVVRSIANARVYYTKLILNK